MAKQQALMLQEPTQALEVLERIVKDPEASVEKMERVIAMIERMNAHKAKADFFAAFNAMQTELPEIDKRGQIIVSGRLQSTYAKNEDIQEAIKPILQKHGFLLRHPTKHEDGKVIVTGVLSHVSGHSETAEFVSEPDASGSKNSIQARASAQSYGARYTTVALLNIIARDVDDDGEGAGAPQAPEGFDGWWADMCAVADEGLERLEETFKKAWKVKKTRPLCEYAITKRTSDWEALKEKAGKAAS